MSIGLSRNARLLLIQLVAVHQHGTQQGLRDDQLAFTLSVRSDRTTVAFAAGARPIETREVHAVVMLRANGLIEEFTTIDGNSDIPRYVVTQAAVLLVGRTIAADPAERAGTPTTEEANAVQSA